MLLRCAFALGSLLAIRAQCHGADCSAAPSMLQLHTLGSSVEDPEAADAVESNVDAETPDAVESSVDDPAPDAVESSVEDPVVSSGTEAAEVPEEVPGEVNITLVIRTSTVELSGTESGANISFLIGDNYTKPVVLTDHAATGSNVSWHARLPAWPSQVRINGTSDSWTVDSIELQSAEMNATLLNGSDGTGRNTISSVGVVELAVPGLEEAVKACVTRDDARIDAATYTTSPSGTPCIFGLDDRDEGSHCIYDNGAYGSHGWCYTDESLSSWGACTEDCPLQGAAKVLGGKIDKALKKLDDAAAKHDAMLKHFATTTTTTPSEAEAAAEEASGDEAPAAKGTDANTTGANASSASAEGSNSSANGSKASGAKAKGE